MEEFHEPYVIHAPTGEIVLECICGWSMAEPAYEVQHHQSAGWPVKSLVQYTNQHLTDVLT